MSELLTREQVEQLFQFASIAELSLAILKHDAALRAKLEAIDIQVDNLASFILTNVPGEPSQSQGACETAMRIIATLQQQLEQVTQECRKVGYESVVELSDSFCDVVNEREELREQLAAMTKERDYAKQMITTQESIIENLGRERDRYRALLEGKP